MYRFLTTGSFESIVFWFTAYYVTERSLRFLLRWRYPTLYEKLLSTRKDLPYFGIMMGFLITLFSAPVCGYAAYTAIYPWQAESGPSESISGVTSSSGAICVVSRGILWVSELNRLGEHTFYLYHHLGSLISLITLLAIQIPLGALYGLYSGLFSELTGDLVWLAGAHGYTIGNSSLFRRLEAVNIALYAVVRAPGIIFGFYFLLNAGLGASEQIICTFQLTTYMAFVIYIFFTRASKMGWLHIVSEHPAHLRVGYHIFTAYGVLMGLGLASLAAGTVILYADVGEPPEVSAAVCRILLCAVSGARLLSLIFEDGLAKLISDPVAAIFRPGFWLHGGILGAGVGVLLSRDSILRPLDMIAALGIVLPLFEAFSRVGCHSYGCCFGRTLSPSEINGSSKPFLWRLLPFPATIYNGRTAAAVRLRPELCSKPLFPIQLVSAALFAFQFASIITILLTGSIAMTYAGWLSLMIHAVLRIITEKFRDDFRGEVGGSNGGLTTVTGIIAGMQVFVGLLGIGATGGGQTLTSEERFARLSGQNGIGSEVMDKSLLYCASFAFALGLIVYGYNFRGMGTWVDRK